MSFVYAINLNDLVISIIVNLELWNFDDDFMVGGLSCCFRRQGCGFFFFPPLRLFCFVFKYPLFSVDADSPVSLDIRSGYQLDGRSLAQR